MKKMFLILCIGILGCSISGIDKHGDGVGGSGGTAIDGRIPTCDAALTDPYRYEPLLSETDYNKFKALQDCLCQNYSYESQLCNQDVPWTYTNTPDLYSSPEKFSLCENLLKSCQTR